MLSQGVILMCAGMGTVFLFLVVLIMAIRISSTIICSIEAGMKANQPKPAAPAPSAAPAAAAAPAGGPKEALTAPLAGLVLRIPTKPGDTVKSGDPVIVIEAMKMEMDIKAPRDCRVASIEVKQGDQLSAEQVLAYIE